MVVTRREIKALGDDWNPTLLWYAKAVRELLDRPVTKKAGWRYLAAMHHFGHAAWITNGYLTASTVLPDPGEQGIYWKQCQHHSWYFWPWHRAYVFRSHRFHKLGVALSFYALRARMWGVHYAKNIW